MKKKYICRAVLLIIISVSFQSCFEKENPVEPTQRYYETGVTEMGPEYLNQVYFDFLTNSVIASNDFNVWDLAFQCSDDGYHVLINYAKIYYATDLGEVDFDAVSNSDKEDVEWYLDSPRGYLDDTAIGFWWDTTANSPVSLNHVYIIDRGELEFGKARYRKLMITGFEKGKYQIKFAALNGSDEGTLEIEKDSTANYVYASLMDGGSVLHLEPNKRDWDVCFSHYIDFAYFLNSETNQIDSMLYGVNGPLLNPYNVEALNLFRFSRRDTTLYNDIYHMSFEDISYSDIKDFPLSSERQAIGHDWKLLILEPEQKWIIYSDMHYIIKDTDGEYFKFRFIDFLKEGVRGYPTFEFKNLPTYE